LQEKPKKSFTYNKKTEENDYSYKDDSYFEINETTNLTKGNLLSTLYDDYGKVSSGGKTYST
jgi:hypothetical protein